jgi:hypothetical protein
VSFVLIQSDTWFSREEFMNALEANRMIELDIHGLRMTVHHGNLDASGSQPKMGLTEDLARLLKQVAFLKSHTIRGNRADLGNDIERERDRESVWAWSGAAL